MSVQGEGGKSQREARGEDAAFPPLCVHEERGSGKGVCRGRAVCRGEREDDGEVCAGVAEAEVKRRDRRGVTAERAAALPALLPFFHAKGRYLLPSSSFLCSRVCPCLFSSFLHENKNVRPSNLQ